MVFISYMQIGYHWNFTQGEDNSLDQKTFTKITSAKVVETYGYPFDIDQKESKIYKDPSLIFSTSCFICN